MYVRTFAGLGQPAASFSPAYSSKDYMWSDPVRTSNFVARPPFVGGRRVQRKLKVRFSEDWPTFRARFKKAIGRLIVFRSDEGKLAESHLEGLALPALHEKLVADKLKAKTFVVLDVSIFYLKQSSGDWILNNFALPETWEWR
jgi:hypothetical protein